MEAKDEKRWKRKTRNSTEGRRAKAVRHFLPSSERSDRPSSIGFYRPSSERIGLPSSIGFYRPSVLLNAANDLLILTVLCCRLSK